MDFKTHQVHDLVQGDGEVDPDGPVRLQHWAGTGVVVLG